MPVNKKLLFVVNVDWFFLSHRLPIALAAKKRNYDVTIVTIETNKRAEIESYGFKFIGIPTSRSGTNVFNEINVLFFLWKVYRREKADVVHHVGIKPVTYGSVVARIVNVPKIVNAITGMGYLFINKEKNRFAYQSVLFFFKIGFQNKNTRFIFQNKDDIQDIKKLDILKDDQIFLIKGSGVDLKEFSFHELPESDVIRIVLPSRMLWDKGVGEFVEAARVLHEKYPGKTEFILAGSVDTENNSAISEEQLLEWTVGGFINWIGFQDKMVDLLASAHIVVLPSYREGLPKCLIEACAIGRPIVTSDVPGCREVVTEGENGFKVPVKDPVALAIAIENLILNRELRHRMALKAREIAEQNFSIESVISKTFEIYNS